MGIRLLEGRLLICLVIACFLLLVAESLGVFVRRSIEVVQGSFQGEFWRRVPSLLGILPGLLF